MTKKDYFGLEYKLSLIFAIFLPTAFVFGAVTRFAEGKILAGLLRIVFGWNILWILDIVYMAKYKKIFRYLNV